MGLGRKSNGGTITVSAQDGTVLERINALFIKDDVTMQETPEGTAEFGPKYPERIIVIDDLTTPFELQDIHHQAIFISKRTVGNLAVGCSSEDLSIKLFQCTFMVLASSSIILSEDGDTIYLPSGTGTELPTDSRGYLLREDETNNIVLTGGFI